MPQRGCSIRNHQVYGTEPGTQDIPDVENSEPAAQGFLRLRIGVAAAPAGMSLKGPNQPYTQAVKKRFINGRTG